MSNKFNSIKDINDFNKLSKQIGQIKHKWMNTTQPDDYDFDNYIDIKFKHIRDQKYEVKIRNKNIYPQYKLSNFFIYNRINGTNGEIYHNDSLNDKEHKFIFDKRNDDAKDFIISAVVESNNDGLLDIELKKNIVL